MSKRKSLLTAVLAILFCQSIYAQDQHEDFMNNIGKIYVVITVIVLIFIGIFVLLLSIEKRIKRLENQNQNNE